MNHICTLHWVYCDDSKFADSCRSYKKLIVWCELRTTANGCTVFPIPEGSFSMRPPLDGRNCNSCSGPAIVD